MQEIEKIRLKGAARVDYVFILKDNYFSNVNIVGSCAPISVDLIIGKDW